MGCTIPNAWKELVTGSLFSALTDASASATRKRVTSNTPTWRCYSAPDIFVSISNQPNVKSIDTLRIVLIEFHAYLDGLFG